MNHLMKNKLIIIFYLISTGFATQVFSNEKIVSIAQCVKIENDLKRLACFDKAAKYSNRDVTIKKNIAIKSTKNNRVKAIAEKKTNSTFGLKKKIEKKKSDEIRSRIDGEFNGWTGKTIFKLQNGQIWKQHGEGKVYHKAMNPEVTITKGIFGGFRLHVTGLNSKVYVKRIK